ncbi:MAG TPA: amino acid adenylation domain-containing protein, partial [Thermoanaerobaculia bacterium]|nr:amino acid adenylation domain-containing protein [Thermoanaerobaculia bacterium]
PLRAPLDGEPAFRELVRRVADRLLGARSHAGVPFEKLVEELNPDRGSGHPPLVQVLFGFLSGPPGGAAALPGLGMSLMEVEAGPGAFDLALNLHERAGYVRGWLGYRTDLFERSTAARWSGHLLELLRRAAAEPDRGIGELSLLSAAERHQLLVEWNEAEWETLAGPPVLRRIEEQAERRPDALALVSGGEHVTYGELDRRACLLAAHLRGLGIGLESRVGLRLDRSPAMVAAMLGVWKAGGAFLALPPDLPAERLAWMTKDAGLAAVLEEGPLPERGSLAGAAALPVLHGSLAYLIYTSGTTGQPKAVMVEHGSLAATLLGSQECFPAGPDDWQPDLFYFSFDASLLDLFGPLRAGATVELLSREEILDLPRLASAFRSASRLHAIPSLLRQVVDFLDTTGEDGGRAARRVFTGGDRVPPELLRDLARAFPAASLTVLYGPTEATIICSSHMASAGEDAERTLIGRPLPGVRLEVVDRWGSPAPIGVAGELCVGGKGVSRGYLGRPDLTAERFTPSPRGSRVYRTGDLVRRWPDGVLEFLGRVDQQVKVRGFRVEPGEVEAALGGLPEVRQAVVVAPEPERRLVAYVVPADAAALAPGAGEQLFTNLRAALARRLPDYMVPSVWVALPALPLSATGKVNRRALPAPAAPRGAGGPETPRRPVEELLAGLWAEVLGLESVGLHGSFFDLGGHSLLATRLLSRVRQALGVELPLAALFDGPTVAELARTAEALLRRKTGGGEELPPVLPRPDPGPAPLSFAQERLWFLDRLEPGPLYNVPVGARLAGPLDVAALAASLGEIVRRHEALRTRFLEERGSPLQEPLPWEPGLVPLSVLDLSELPDRAREAEARRLATQEARRPFDLASGRLLRLALVRLETRDHLLLLTVHHVAADGWSMGVLLAELSVLYPALSVDLSSPLPEPPVQYVDFAVWQRAWLTGEPLEREVEHWRERLAGAPEVLEIPADRPRHPGGTIQGGQRPFHLAAGVWGGLSALARREGGTPFMGLLAAFQALLSRATGQRDVVVGAPIANRTRPEIEGLIGFFANTLVLRLDLTGDPSFQELARRARAVSLEAYAHQDVPFEKLVVELAPERALGRNPLFQAMLVWQDAVPSLSLPGMDVELVEGATGTAKFEMVLALTAAEGGLVGGMEYSADLYDPATIERVLGHLRTLLEGAVADPGTRLSDLPLLTPAERQELAAWSRPPLPYPLPRLVHEMVAARAAAAPEAEAVVFGDEWLSYGELVGRARRMARRLVDLGVGPDVPVGVFLERSPEMMLAILAVLEAGGAYVPLDPSYPEERLRVMLEDSGAPVVVTQAGLAKMVPEGVRVVVDGEGMPGESSPPGPLSHLPPTPPPGEGERRHVTPENLAYVTYTSGSTGRPKGVAMTHAAISAMLAWQLRTSAAGGGRTLQFTSLSFDVSFQEIFGTWCAGGAVVLVSEEVRRDPPLLVQLLSEQRVERLFLPFVALQQVAVAAAAGPFPRHLREMMSAGEQLYVTPQVAALFTGLSGAALHNHYGPSETHAVTWLTLEGDPARWPERPTIGGPVDHARTLLLDAGLQPVPRGVPGEIWVGGAGLARGYLGQPALTAERFLPDPFQEIEGWTPGARMYRTGDLARLLPDGELDFLGRADAQVKVRGHRIEPAEVEITLARHPAVRQAAVTVRGESSGARRLVAYVAFHPEVEAPPFIELRSFLEESLPDPMVPSLWMRLDALPLTPSGKVDRRALPAPVTEDDAAGAPHSPVEELLAGIWADVLEVERVGVHDGFFDLGGHSLLATRVMSRVREAFGIELPLRRLFESPTVSGLARAVEAALAGDAPVAGGISRTPRQGALPLSFSQERLWFVERLGSTGTAYSLPIALHLRGDLDVPALAAVLDEITRRHEILRTVFTDHDGTPAQVVLPFVPRPLPEVDLSGLETAARQGEALRFAGEEAKRPFAVETGPLLRATLAHIAPGERLLLVNMHHIVSDGWSMGVLLRELVALYDAFRAGQPSPLPELPIQYVDFAVWQRQSLSGEVLERHLDYWHRRLTGAPAALELPTDRLRPTVQSFRGGHIDFTLDRHLG